MFNYFILARQHPKCSQKSMRALGTVRLPHHNFKNQPFSSWYPWATLCFGVTKTSCSTLEKKEEGTRAQNISGERQSSNFARAFFCSVGTSSSELIFRISSFLFLLHEIFGGISLMQLQAFSKNISGDTGRKIILLELRRSWIKRKVM